MGVKVGEAVVVSVLAGVGVAVGVLVSVLSGRVGEAWVALVATRRKKSESAPAPIKYHR